MKFRPILSMATALATLILLPDAAQAQSAEQHARDMNDIAATPPQGSGEDHADAEPGYDLPSLPSEPGFMAAAYHADTGSTWVSVGHKTLDLARQRVLERCKVATGSECDVAAAIGGTGQVYLAQDGMGQSWIRAAVNDEMLANPDVSTRHCLTNSFGCDLVAVYDSGAIFLNEDPGLDQSKDYFPKGKLNWNRWAMVARPVDPAAVGKSWLISGKENSVATRKEILDRCQTDSGQRCAISAYAVNGKKVTDAGWADTNGLLVHFVDGRGQNRWTAALAAAPKKRKKRSPLGDPFPTLADPVTVKERIARICPPSSCRVIATYDAATPRVVVIADEG